MKSQMMKSGFLEAAHVSETLINLEAGMSSRVHPASLGDVQVCYVG